MLRSDGPTADGAALPAAHKGMELAGEAVSERADAPRMNVVRDTTAQPARRREKVIPRNVLETGSTAEAPPSSSGRSSDAKTPKRVRTDVASPTTLSETSERHEGQSESKEQAVRETWVPERVRVLGRGGQGRLAQAPLEPPSRGDDAVPFNCNGRSDFRAWAKAEVRGNRSHFKLRRLCVELAARKASRESAPETTSYESTDKRMPLLLASPNIGTEIDSLSAGLFPEQHSDEGRISLSRSSDAASPRFRPEQHSDEGRIPVLRSSDAASTSGQRCAERISPRSCDSSSVDELQHGRCGVGSAFGVRLTGRSAEASCNLIPAPAAAESQQEELNCVAASVCSSVSASASDPSPNAFTSASPRTLLSLPLPSTPLTVSNSFSTPTGTGAEDGDIVVVDEAEPSVNMFGARTDPHDPLGRDRRGNIQAASDRRVVDVVDVESEDQDEVMFVRQVLDAEVVGEYPTFIPPLPDGEGRLLSSPSATGHNVLQSSKKSGVFLENFECPICFRAFRPYASPDYDLSAGDIGATPDAGNGITAAPGDSGASKRLRHPGERVWMSFSSSTPRMEAGDSDGNETSDLYMTKCGHFFCGTCLTRAVHERRRCPRCNQSLGPRQFFKCYF